MPCHVVNVAAVMLLPLTLSVRKRVTSNFRGMTCNFVRVTRILGVWPIILGVRPEIFGM